MTVASETPVDVTARMLEAADTDIATFFSMFTEDCEFRLGNNEPVRGRQNIQEWVSGFLGGVAGLRHVILEMWSDGDVAAARADVTYSMQNGATFTLPVVTRTRVRHGQACEYLIFMDPGPVIAASTS
ncbi:nuclear transport factor 2 family protein [Actinomycetospora sp. OC33-EN08]|uniref:Nuclear transport factor 2 family protein n=1 Tax=Actinomycetospora aurantiaca TaxID=3129233 RepID=A0ABU8MY39_9PSEU